MKAITILQPWATLVAIGAKRIETRGWPTRYRGPIAIHAAKAFPLECQALCVDPPFLPVLLKAGIRNVLDLPRGEVLATATLADVIQFPHGGTVELLRSLSSAPDEFAFGDYRAGRYGFVLRNVQCLAEPVPARGAQGLWEWAA